MSAPELRSDLVLVEQRYRGEQCYVVKDPASGKYLRFRPLEVFVMQQFDGTRTPTEIAAVLHEQGAVVSASTVAAFARKVATMGLLVQSVAERSVLLMERLRAERRRRLKRTHYAGSILRMRWSIGDPQRMFDRWTPRLRFFFSRTFLAMSVGMFAIYVAILVGRWDDIGRALSRLTQVGTYTPLSFLTLYCTAIVIIVVHELGHGFACKHFGGQVHEMGFMLIYFQPAFYCNVNDAWTFPERRARLWVTAAGSWIQLVLAGIGAVVWWAAASGTLASQIGLDAIVIGGVTTVVANANPLIPLDGYYALSDYLEIPNLRQRALRHIGWFLKRSVLRLALPEPAADARERIILLTYGALALAYSSTILVLFASTLFGWASRALGTIGVVAFALMLWSSLRTPARTFAQAITTSLREHRASWGSLRFRRWAGGAGLTLLVLLLGVPCPITVGGTFIAAPAFAVALQAPTSGVVVRVYATEGAQLEPGAPVVTLRNLALEHHALTARRLTDSVAALAQQARAGGHTADAQRLEAERSEYEAETIGVRAELAALALRTPVRAVVLTPHLEETLGRPFAAGADVAQLGDPDSVEVRVRLEAAGGSLVTPGATAVLVSYARPWTVVHARVRSVAIAESRAGDALEARVRVPQDGRVLRPGMTGEIKIIIRRSNLLGALWWALQKRVRTDFLL